MGLGAESSELVDFLMLRASKLPLLVTLNLSPECSTTSDSLEMYLVVPSQLYSDSAVFEATGLKKSVKCPDVASYSYIRIPFQSSLTRSL